MQDVNNQMVNLITEAYSKLKELPTPDAYKFGGTYYGSTQLFHSVGNMLDLIEWEPYTSYNYGGQTNYKSLYGIRIGGAYEGVHIDEILKAVKEFGTTNRKQLLDAGWVFIDHYGTNFSVIGIADRR